MQVRTTAVEDAAIQDADAAATTADHALRAPTLFLKPANLCPLPLPPLEW